MLAEERLQRRHRGASAISNQRKRSLPSSRAVYLLGEVLGLEEARDHGEDVVADEQRSKELLL